MTPACFVISSGERLAIYEWGERPTQKHPRPTVVLVHGYPDRAEVWTAVATRLAAEAHVVAYDVRGSGLSSAPRGTEPYAFAHLSADLRRIIDAVSPGRPVHLVGHDWGALQAWDALLSGTLDGRVASFSTAAPHLDHLGHWFRSRLARPTPRNIAHVAGRLVGSSYMFAIQLPWFPELIWKLGLAQIWPRLVFAVEGTEIPPSPGRANDALTGLGLYRANFLPPLLRPRSRTTEVPVQAIVMRHDPFVPAALFAGLETTAPRLRRLEIAAGHWGLLSHSEALANGVAQFVKSIEEQ